MKPLLLLLATLSGCGYVTVMSDEQIKNQFSANYQQLLNVAEQQIDIENSRLNFRRACEIKNDFLSDVQALCRSAQKQVSVSLPNCEELLQRGPEDCSREMELNPFTGTPQSRQGTIEEGATP